MPDNPNQPEEQPPVEETPVEDPQEDKPDPAKELNDKIVKEFKGRMESSKRVKKTFTKTWKRNIEIRLGKEAASIYTAGLDVEDDNQSEINPDWSLTKTKTANLYSQVPAVQVTHENKQYAQAVPPFAKALNYELSEKRANVGVCMEEVLNDVVNAAGIGWVMVDYMARFETVQVPLKEEHKPLQQSNPELFQRGVDAGIIPTMPVENVTDYTFPVSRGRPGDLLWPAEFVGSNFDDGDWIGRSGKCSWAIAKNNWPKLKDDDKQKLLAQEDTKSQDDLRYDPDTSALADVKVVNFDEIYYWRYRVDPDEKSFKAIWKLVMVKGLDDPVLHEAWKGQQADPQTKKYVGSCRFPIRVLTLTYVSDNPIPPSDSEAGRPQVNDMRRSRSQMFQNRDRSTPLRWFDVNRIDPLIQQNLMRGIIQGMIPTNGDGSRSIGEIARASYPSEDLAFDQQVKTDLMESWHLGPGQTGQPAPHKQTKAEVDTNNQSFATVMGQDRGKVANFFLSIVEVLAGWMVLYSDFPSLSDQEKQMMMQAWDQKHIIHDVALKIRPDAAIVLDSQQRVQRLTQFLNMTAKSGFVNIQPIIMELAELTGLDPAEVIVQPQPKPEEPSMSFSFGGKDDVTNVMVLAVMLAKGAAPTEENIKQAGKLIKAAMAEAATPPVPEQPPQQPGQPPQQPGQGPGGGGPPDAPQPPKDYGLAEKVAKRGRDISGV